MQGFSPPELMGRAIHVWTMPLEAPDAVTATFRRLLSPDEIARADRFAFDHLRSSFVLARGALRAMLARYMRAQPRDLTFEYGEKGKPRLIGEARLQFNVSHSGSMALYAYTHGCELGADIEQIKPLDDMRAIAERFFCVEESNELMALSPEDRQRAFFLCWTRKEAYIKATGDGLSVPLDAFQVTFRPGAEAAFLHLNRDPAAAADWSLHDLPAPPGYAAALAYRDSIRPVLAGLHVTPEGLLS